jgi:hypothetical protein
MLIRDPVLQVLNRRLVAERGVAATAVVEFLDVIEQIGNGLGAARVACVMHPFVLQAFEEAPGRGVVPAVSLAAYRARPANLGKLASECVARILADRSEWWFSPGRSPPRVRSQVRHPADAFCLARSCSSHRL